MRRRRVYRVIRPLREAIQPARATALDHVSPVAVLGAAVLFSVAAHLIALRVAAGLQRHETIAPKPDEVRIVVVDAPPPKPVEEPKPEVPQVNVVRPRKSAPASVEAPPPPADVPPPPIQEAPAETAKPQLITGLGLQSTSATGSFAVGVGNTLYGKAAPKAAAPADAKPYRAKEYAAAYALTDAPVFLDNVSLNQVRSFYPEDARKARIEGSVAVKLTVDDDGTVVKVVVVNDPGHGFGPAAARLARLYKFKPARVDGRAVATEIAFTIHFEVE